MIDSTNFSSASLTNNPEYFPASSVNFTASSIGEKIVTFLFVAMLWSSSPFAGDKCTSPLPAFTSTKSSATVT